MHRCAGAYTVSARRTNLPCKKKETARVRGLRVTIVVRFGREPVSTGRDRRHLGRRRSHRVRRRHRRRRRDSPWGEPR